MAKFWTVTGYPKVDIILAFKSTILGVISASRDTLSGNLTVLSSLICLAACHHFQPTRIFIIISTASQAVAEHF